MRDETAGLPIVSVITGTYNSEAYLERYFRMLDEQTCRAWEAWLVDDGSRDSTVAMITRKMREDRRYHLVHKVPEGSPSRSRAAGLARARGRYVAFCDHDDFWAPQKLELQLEVLHRHPEAAIVHTDRIVWTSLGYPDTMMHFDAPLAQLPIQAQRPEDVMYKGLRIIFSSFIAPRALVEHVGFHPDLRGVDDFYLFLRLSTCGPILHIPLPLTFYYAHQHNLSHASGLFVEGLYRIAAMLESDDVPEVMRRSVRAQACRTEAVTLLATDRHRAFGLLLKSMRLYFIPSTLNRFMFLMLTLPLPLWVQRPLMRQVKRLKFIFPTLKDIWRPRTPGP